MNVFRTLPAEDPDRYDPPAEMVRHNCRLALRIWAERVTPSQVRLETWHSPSISIPGCGSTACFGGHLRTWPEFTALPGATDRGGEPRILDPEYNSLDKVTFSAERMLFGCDWIFNQRNYDADDDLAEDEQVSDYEVVTLRLAKRLREVGA